MPGTQLREGTYTYWVDRDGVKQDKVSTLAIDFDQTAPQVYIESPAEAQAWPDDIVAKAEPYRERLTDAVAEADDDLLEKYLDQGELSGEELAAHQARVRPTRKALRYFDQVEWDSA